jgi:pantetheine-phosphate adenylyltransferase
MRIGIYPGTFDPVTNGHMDIISRAAQLVDKLVVGVGINAGKAPMFNAAERSQMVQAGIAKAGLASKVEVIAFDQLLIDFAKAQQASVIFRGLRAVSDFEYEFQMAGMNRNLNAAIETVFLMCSDKHQFVSSRFIKEIARLGGDVRSFVSSAVYDQLRQKLNLGVDPAIDPRLNGGDPP